MNQMDKTPSFRNEYFFLSNFYPCLVRLDGITYPSSEHAYVAMKSINHNERIRISKMKKPGDAKKYGRTLKRPDWDEIKLDIMYKILLCKFTQNEDLKEKLLSTGDLEIVERNNWNDTFYGVCDGKGENHLGKLLMKVREELKNEKAF